MSAIKVEGLNKSFGDHQVLKNISFEVQDNSIVAITGPSGCGKSTLLNILGLIEKMDSGYVSILGKENVRLNSREALMMRRNIIGYVFQDFALCENDTVEYNLKLALKYSKIKKRDIEKEIDNVLLKIGLPNVKKQKVCTLSGGEQQRVALARVLLKPCKIVLADEPTGNLDEDNKRIVFDLFKMLKNDGKTVIIVTHDHDLACKCDYTIQLSNNR